MKKKLLALFLALVMVGAVLPGCGDGSKDPGGQGNNGKTGEPVKGGEITVGIAQDLDDSLDPHQTVAAGTREVLFNIFEGLVKPNSDGEMIPAVAEKYTLSEDGTTYTFTLREGVKFHNGQTVTAEDVVYSINRCAAVPDLSVGIRAVKASRSELFIIEKGLSAGFPRAGRLAKTKTDNIYWSSSEFYNNPANNALYVNVNNGNVNNNNKNNRNSYVRPVLAFSIKTLR